MRGILFLLLALPGLAQAEFAIDIHGFSKHLGTDVEYNETNPGLGLAYGGENIKVIAGFYKDSFSERTTYAGVEAMASGAIRLGVAMGVSHGYTRETPDYIVVELNGQQIQTNSYERTKEEPTTTPMLAPIIELGGDISARVMYLPKTDDTPAVVTLSARAYF